MSETLQLEEDRRTFTTRPSCWSNGRRPGASSSASIRPALARSERRLAGEAPFGLIPLRIMVPSYFLEAFLIFAAIAMQVKIAELRPFVAPRFSRHDVIYYSGDELPRTEDLGGAEAGTTGRAGGDEAHHRTQTIKIARGGSLVPKVVDAPNLKLPASTRRGGEPAGHQAESRTSAFGGIALKPYRAEPGHRPGRSASECDPRLHPQRSSTRFEVIAPAPSVSRDRTLTAPNLSAILIPPAPNVAGEHTLVAPALAPAVIPPAPSVSRDRALNAPSLTPRWWRPLRASPASRSRSTPTLAANVIPPAAGGVSRETSSTPVQMTNMAVIPPPVSAPERAGIRNPKLTLQAPSVVAPPPSADVSQDLHRLRQRQHSGSVEDSGASAANAIRQRIVHEQSDGQDLWRQRGRAATTGRSGKRADRRAAERHSPPMSSRPRRRSAAAQLAGIRAGHATARGHLSARPWLLRRLPLGCRAARVHARARRLPDRRSAHPAWFHLRLRCPEPVAAQATPAVAQELPAAHCSPIISFHRRLLSAEDPDRAAPAWAAKAQVSAHRSTPAQASHLPTAAAAALTLAR